MSEMNAPKSVDQKKLGIVAGILAVVLFVAVNVFSGAQFKSARLDLTESKLFTLSDGTREVLKDIKEPVVLRLYASRSLAEAAPAYGDFIRRVREILDHYADLSGGMVQIRGLNPESYSVEEDEAVAYGLQGVQLDQGGELVYFGLAATNSTDDTQVIPFFDTQRERYLEYDLTKLVFNLANPEKKKIGLMTFLPIDTDPLKQYKPWVVVEQMEQFFETRAIGRSVSYIPDDIDLLMIVHPSGVGDPTLYAIEQYVLRGGRAMIFVDPQSDVQTEMAAAMRQPPSIANSDLPKLFDAWGIEYDAGKFVGDRAAATRVEVPSGGRSVVTDYVSWIGLGPDNFNSDDVSTSELNRIFMTGAGSIAKKDGADITFTPLISTGEHSMRIDADKIRMRPDPVQLLKDFQSELTPYAIAARISGKFKTAFPDGPPKGKDDAKPKEPQGGHLAQATEPANVVIIADTDILADRSWIQFQSFFGRQVPVPTADNATFVINALDNLLGSNALINLRSRGIAARPFHRVEALKDEAERRFRKTEQDLLKKMEATKEKIGKLDISSGESQAILTEGQKTALTSFKADLVSIRRQLREVQHSLQKDIEALDTWLKILNIWAVPAIVSVIAVVMAWVRRRKYRQRALNG
ncbi:MAG: Gldg family protein [Rhodospirillales bacterium]|nr:Gldg family protein [Rhodospirillales bacterium]